MFQRIVIWYVLNLNPVGFFQFEAGVGYQVLQRAVVSEQDQSLAVPVQPASGVDVRLINKVLERLSASVIGELGEYVKRLIEEN